MNFFTYGFPVSAMAIGIAFVAPSAKWLMGYYRKKKRCTSSRSVVAINVKEVEEAGWLVSFKDYSAGEERIRSQRIEGTPPPIIPGRVYQLHYNPLQPEEQMPLSNEECLIRKVLVLCGVALLIAGGGFLSVLLAWPH